MKNYIFIFINFCMMLLPVYLQGAKQDSLGLIHGGKLFYCIDNAQRYDHYSSTFYCICYTLQIKNTKLFIGPTISSFSDKMDQIGKFGNNLGMDVGAMYNLGRQKRWVSGFVELDLYCTRHAYYPSSHFNDKRSYVTMIDPTLSFGVDFKISHKLQIEVSYGWGVVYVPNAEPHSGTNFTERISLGISYHFIANY
jgi:hypothetical protein